MLHLLLEVAVFKQMRALPYRAEEYHLLVSLLSEVYKSPPSSMAFLTERIL